MSLLSFTNNVATAVVRGLVGSEAATVYKETSVAIGGAALETVVVAGELTVGTVSTVAAAIPALASYTKGIGMGLLQAASIEEFTEKWESMSGLEKQQTIQQMGLQNIRSLAKALKDEEKTTNS